MKVFSKKNFSLLEALASLLIIPIFFTALFGLIFRSSKKSTEKETSKRR